MKRLQGFTLIELLIVVAILGILAVIAVPNFQAAMIRARVARTQADMQALAKAIELLRSDKGALLVDRPDFAFTDWGKRRVRELFHGVGYNTDTQRSFDEVYAPLTSPTPYLSPIPRDYFRGKSVQHHDPELAPRGWLANGDSRYAYNHFEYAAMDPEGPKYHGWPRVSRHEGGDPRNILYNPPPQPGDFYLEGIGPWFATVYEPGFLFDYNRRAYDISNGLYSNGVFVFHSRTGFVKGRIHKYY